MTITYKVWDFPNVPIQSQLFHVPGAYFDGGFTSGGARILSPEPGGGRAVLEMKMAFRVAEWEAPFASWLMSKINGDIFRVQLTRTPQLVAKSALVANGVPTTPNGIPWNEDGLFFESNWNNGQPWNDDGYYFPTTDIALRGSQRLVIDLSLTGPVLQHGHVIGHLNHSYMIDDIEYDALNVATVTVRPALRRNVNVNDMIYAQPYFIGQISNGDEIRSTYEASNVGNIELNRIIFQEAIIP